MCTVSIVPVGERIRIVCNRDEQRTRTAASPPAIHPTDAGHAIWPIDPQSGGTWIGANSAGLAMVLLNRRTPPVRTSTFPLISRGVLIPHLLQWSTAVAVVDAANALPLHRFEPFTLAIVQERVVRTMTSDGARSTWSVQSLLDPLLLTSSSLGDDLVSRPRRRLFVRMLKRGGNPLDGQERFHRHSWPRHPEISVLMSRPEAATVSRTILDITPGGVTMRYMRVEA
jgi:hypothetical protein